MINVVPHKFMQGQSPYPHTYADGQSCILYKSLQTPNLKADYFVASHVLTLVLQGQKIITPYDGNPIVVEKNQLILIPRDLYLIQDIIASDGHFESWLFFIHDTLLQEFLATLPAINTGKLQLQERGAGLPVFAYTEDLNRYTDSLIPLLSAMHDRNPQFLRLKLLELLHLMASGPEQQLFMEQCQRLRPRKRNVRLFMEQHYDKPLRVEDYAQLTGRSLSSFLRDFKSAFEATPKQWLKSMRMEKARLLLHEGKANVTNAAFAVGYENLSHFIQAFKAIYHVSPKQYLIRQRQERLGEYD